MPVDLVFNGGELQVPLKVALPETLSHKQSHTRPRQIWYLGWEPAVSYYVRHTLDNWSIDARPRFTVRNITINNANTGIYIVGSLW